MFQGFDTPAGLAIIVTIYMAPPLNSTHEVLISLYRKRFQDYMGYQEVDLRKFFRSGNACHARVWTIRVYIGTIATWGLCSATRRLAFGWFSFGRGRAAKALADNCLFIADVTATGSAEGTPINFEPEPVHAFAGAPVEVRYAVANQSSLIEGIMLNTTTGRLYGTAEVVPVVQPVNITIIAYDATINDGEFGTEWESGYGAMMEETRSEVVADIHLFVADRLKKEGSRADAVKGSLFQGAAPAVIGGRGTKRYECAACGQNPLPPGLMIEEETGRIFGIPTATGEYRVQTRAVDVNNATSLRDLFIITVYDSLSVTWPTEAVPGNTETAGEYEFARGDAVIFDAPDLDAVIISGGVPPVTYKIEGLEGGEYLMEEATGSFKGIAHRLGEFQIQVYAVDTTGASVLVTNGPTKLTVRECANHTCLHGGTCVNTEDANGALSDFDANFECDCGNADGFMLNPGTGLCDMPSNATASGSGASAGSLAPAVSSGVIGGLCVLIAAVLLYMRHKTKNEPYDFDKAWDDLRGQGLLASGDTVNKPREISRHKMTILEQLGSGAFGEVSLYIKAQVVPWRPPPLLWCSRCGCLPDNGHPRTHGPSAHLQVSKALLDEHDRTGTPAFSVAVKILKDNHNTAAKDELMREAALMAQFKHKNVLPLIGCVTKGCPVMLVTQYCEFGSLLQFLSRGEGLEILSLTSQNRIALDVAKGMAYLGSKGFIHRDLAAR